MIFWIKRWFTLIAVAFVWLAALGSASAQLRVDLSLKRALFIRFEPLIATIRVTNVSGRELELANEGNHKWLSFQIETAAGGLVPPYDADYQLNPVQIGPGQSIQRLINLTPLYPMSEFGIYRIRATVFSQQFGNYFSSNPPLNIEITEGRVLWQQTVGVPDAGAGAGATRAITLLAHRLPKDTQLYLRIEDPASGAIYCTHQLGRFLSFGKPEIELDAANNIHVLQNIAPKSFMYTEAGLDGKILARKQFDAIKEKPTLKRDAAGGVQVVGGYFIDPSAAAQQGATPQPKVSDRPVALPTPQE
jgi:hypothetical protein